VIINHQDLKQQVQVIKDLESVAKEESPVGLNEIMLAVKSLEESLKKTRATITERVNKEKLILTDFHILEMSSRKLKDPYAFYMKLLSDYGYTTEGMFEASMLSFSMPNSEKSLVNVIKHNKDLIKNGDAQETAKAVLMEHCTMSDPIVSLRSSK